MAKQSSSNKFSQTSGADAFRRGKSRSGKAKSTSQTKKRIVAKSLNQKVKSKSRTKTSSSVQRGKNVPAKRAKEEAKEATKDETSLIGPDDYLHLFKGAPKKKYRKANGNDSSMAIPSDAPTALLAPEDYDHMYTAVPKSKQMGSGKVKRKTSSKKKTKKKCQDIPAVPDDAPTVLKEIVAKERAKQPVNLKVDEDEEDPTDDNSKGCCIII